MKTLTILLTCAFALGGVSLVDRGVKAREKRPAARDCHAEDAGSNELRLPNGDIMLWSDAFVVGEAAAEVLRSGVLGCKYEMEELGDGKWRVVLVRWIFPTERGELDPDINELEAAEAELQPISAPAK